jgi:hypothetical protein
MSVAVFWVLNNQGWTRQIGIVPTFVRPFFVNVKAQIANHLGWVELDVLSLLSE